MSYKHSLQCWTPEGKPLTASGANKMYIVSGKRIARIVPAIDTYVLLTDDKSAAIADSSNGALLKANQEYFIDTGDFSFMSLSDSTGSVILVKQEGMARY